MTIKKYKDYMNEAAPGEFSFKTDVDSKEVEHLDFPFKGKDQYIESNNLKVEWEMDWDLRSSGIKSMAPIIKKVTGTFLIVTPGEADDDEAETEFEYNGAQSDWQAICEFSVEYEFGNAIAPHSVLADYKDKKITIRF